MICSLSITFYHLKQRKNTKKMWICAKQHSKTKWSWEYYYLCSKKGNESMQWKFVFWHFHTSWIVSESWFYRNNVSNANHAKRKRNLFNCQWLELYFIIDSHGPEYDDSVYSQFFVNTTFGLINPSIQQWSPVFAHILGFGHKMRYALICVSNHILIFKFG